MIALATFFFLYNNDTIQNKWLISALFFIIIFFTQLSILTKHVGRINFAVIFLFLLFTNYKKLFKPHYFILILTLFCLSFPILGIFKVFSGESILSILGISNHMGIQETTRGILSTLILFLKTFPYSFLPHAFFLTLLFFIFLIFHLFAVFTKKNSIDDEHTKAICSLCIFSLFWFLFAAISMFIARGFIFDPLYFTRFEITIFLIPQALFLLSYCIFIWRKYYSNQKIFHYIILIFLLLAILHNTQRLNEWRGGWGAYFLGYDTARQYVDEHAEHTALLVPLDHASPTYFVPPSTNKHIMVADLTNSSLVHSFLENYTAIYIANRGPLFFDDASIINIANLTIIDSSPYGIIKKVIGKYYPNPMYVYKLVE